MPQTVFRGGTGVGGHRRSKGTAKARSTTLVTMDFVPSALDRDGICVAQQLAAAGNLILNGALVTNGIGAINDTGGYGRCVGVFSTGNLAAIAFTVRGFDVDNMPLTSTIATGPNNTTVATTKAFARVTSVSASAAVGTNVEVGTVDTFGLPCRILSVVEVVNVKWDGTLAANAATFVAGVVTSPATATTGDVRGTVAQAGNAADGARRLVVVLVCDPTDITTFAGVPQFASGLE